MLRKYFVFIGSIRKRLRSVVSLDAKTGANNTVLTLENENTLLDPLLWAGDHHLALGRSELVEAGRTICLESCAISWGAEKGPGQGWVQGSCKQHPGISTGSSRIFKAKRVQADGEGRLWQFYRIRNECIPAVKHAHYHVWNKDNIQKVAGDRQQAVGATS